MAKTITFTLDSSSISKAVRELREYSKGLQAKANEMSRRLAEIGLESATIYFQHALYAGTNDVECTLSQDGNTFIITAHGESVCFIEFGTGVRYADNHPAKPDGLVGHGQYGKKRGANPKGWFYKGEPGTNGVPSIVNPKLMHTYGNPANQCLWNASKEMRDAVKEIFVECFG